MKNNDNKKKKILIAVLVVVLLLVVIGSGVAIGVFRSTKGGASGSGDKKAFTDKLTTETTTLAKATTKATTEKAAKEKAKKDNKKTTTEKSKKVASVSGGITTESKNDSNTKATTEKATQAPAPSYDPEPEPSYDPQPTEAPYIPDTEVPTEAPTQAPTEAPTEAPTTQHQHTWEDVTETVTENVKVKDAWDEQVLKYYCSYCGADCDVVGSGHISRCGRKYYDPDFGEEIYEGASWKGRYETINHPAEYTTKEVTKVVGQKCSTCGAIK